MISQRFPNNQNIYLEIETFYINKTWAIELCEKLENLNNVLEKPFKFGVNLRVTPNVNYDDLFSACKKSNFKFINIGLESGNKRIRREILKRNYSNQDVINTVNSARKSGLKIAFFNLIGIPRESYNDFKDTVKINRICQPDWVMTSIFFPYPGTELYNLSKYDGLLNGASDTKMERSKAILDLPNFSNKQIKKAYEWFYYDIFRGNKPIYILLIRVFVTKLRSFPRAFKFYLTFTKWSTYKKLRLLLIKNGIWKI